MSTIQLKNSTVPGKVPLPGDLTAGELALNSADGKAYMKLDNGTVKELGGGTPTPVITPWVRNPTWLPMPARTSADEVTDLLVAVYPESNYIALNFAVSGGGYTVDWGDGTAPVNSSSSIQTNYLYDYNAAGLAGTNGPVTFDASTSTVNRTGHGYTNGMKISFAEIVTTVGIVQLQTYYVINATTDTFQLSSTEGGSAITLTNNGTGAILPYKQAMVKVTPTTSGSTLITVNLQAKYNAIANLQAYSQPILDATVSAGCTILTIGGSSVPMRLMERCTILRYNDTTLDNLFSNCNSLQSVPLFNTANVTNMPGMFSNCTSLQSVPLFDTANVTNMTSMFSVCVNLKLVPLFNTSKVTNMSSMFNGCNSLQTVPLFDTNKVTNMGGTFTGCSSLQAVPFFDTSNVTSMLGTFTDCNSIKSIPLFNTQNVTQMQQMFSGCKLLESVPLFNTQNVTNMGNSSIGGMFTGCSSMQAVPFFDTSNVTSMSGMFSGCVSLQTVPLFNTSKVTRFDFMFNGCSNIGSIPAYDTTAVTGTTAFTSMFSTCSSLQQIPDMNFNRAAITTTASYTNLVNQCSSLSKFNLSPGNGPKFTFSVLGCKLSAASLDQLYTSLPTVTGQTITVTGNVGIAGDNPAIATAKGWTVTGS